MKERIKLSTWNMKESVIEGKILPYFKRKCMCDIKPRDVVEWRNTCTAGMINPTLRKRTSNCLVTNCNTRSCCRA